MTDYLGPRCCGATLIGILVAGVRVTPISGCFVGLGRTGGVPRGEPAGGQLELREVHLAQPEVTARVEGAAVAEKLSDYTKYQPRSFPGRS